MAKVCKICGGPIHPCKESGGGFDCFHCDDPDCRGSFQAWGGRTIEERKMEDKTTRARAALGMAWSQVAVALELMDTRSTNCVCGSRRHENHKEYLAAQEMRAILGRIEKLKNKLAEAGRENG